MMLSNKKGIIFDLDGTLVDSMWIWKDIDIEYLSNFGLTLPADLQQQIEGMSFTETAAYFKETFRLSCSLDNIKETWTAMAKNKYRCEVPLKQGAEEFLLFLKNRGCKIGIATSNSRDLALEALEAHNITGLFDTLRTSCEVCAGKPAPDIYLKAAEDFGLAPEECLVFEDIPNGILAGKRAGMKVCAVEDNFSSGLSLKKKEMADYYIHNYFEILEQSYEVLHA